MAAALPALAVEPWQGLWLPDTSGLKPGAERVFDGKSYATFETRRFLVHYPAAGDERERDRRLALQVASRLDRLYDFLAERLGTKPAAPIHAVLIEGQYGKSLTRPEENAVLTGDRADQSFVLGSFFHELVHLFNFSVEGGKQDFWSGELFAQYHADRLMSLGVEHRERYRRMLAGNPKGFNWDWIENLDREFNRMPEAERQKLMELGVSIHYFLEDEFGAGKSVCFWKARLLAQPGDPWKRCFDRSRKQLQKGWLEYYGL